MGIVVYGNGCPKCNILIKKLDEKGIIYSKVDDMEEIIKVGKENNISSMPITIWNDEVLDFKSAIETTNKITRGE
jgi:predicted thioredoxin/glutaredoxin